MIKTITLKNPFLLILFGSLLFTILYLIPVTTFGQADSAPKDALVYECAGGKPGECDWNDLISAVQKAVNWGATLAISISVVVVAYAGFVYMTSGGSPGERAKANKMFEKVAIGIFVILCAWLIVNLITSSLLKDELKNVFK